jgi:hypothetical protein
VARHRSFRSASFQADGNNNKFCAAHQPIMPALSESLLTAVLSYPWLRSPPRAASPAALRVPALSAIHRLSTDGPISRREQQTHRHSRPLPDLNPIPSPAAHCVLAEG